MIASDRALMVIPMACANDGTDSRTLLSERRGAGSAIQGTIRRLGQGSHVNVAVPPLGFAERVKGLCKRLRRNCASAGGPAEIGLRA